MSNIPLPTQPVAPRPPTVDEDAIAAVPIPAGSFVHLKHDVNNRLVAFLADYNANRPAVGWVDQTYLIGQRVIVHEGTPNDKLSGLSINTFYYLGDNGLPVEDEQRTLDPGTINQPLGYATSSTSLAVDFHHGWTITPGEDNPGGGGGGGDPTNLSVGGRTSTSLNILSSTGDDATVPAATTSLAGLFTAADKSKLDGISGTSSTDLTVANRTGLTLDLLSSTGADATIPNASTTEAGLLTATDKVKLDATVTGPHPETDLSITNHGANTLDVESSTGTDITLPAATQSLAGLFTADDKTKLDGIPEGGGGGGGGGAANLAVENRNTNTLDITSSTGTDATIPAATTSLSGLLTGTDKTKLDGITGSGTTDLAVENRDADSLDITSSTGSDAVVPVATTSLAGLLSATDKTKLDAVATGPHPETDLSIANRNASTLDVLSSTGVDVTIPQATTTLAGLLNAAGKVLLESLFPMGTYQAGEAVVAGRAANIYEDGGAVKVRHADKTAGYEVHGFFASSVAQDASVTLQPLSNFTPNSLTAGVNYYIGDAGVLVTTKPTASGDLVQRVGYSKDKTSVIFAPGEPYRIGS